ADKMPIIYPDFWGTERPYTAICAGGESWLLFRARVGSFLNDMVAWHGESDPPLTVAVVCHGGVVEGIFDVIFEVGPHRRVEIWSHNTGIVHFEYFPQSKREKWRLHAHGLVHHLMNGGGEWLGSEPMLRQAERNSILESTKPPEDVGPVVSE
ncbi:MAG TPA: histidine phosphatase family protein, partial [Aggregatilineaceae bacterium]|nr:histidine phosphatase family protein [Aggregatilineaceae bacterium]